MTRLWTRDGEGWQRQVRSWKSDIATEWAARNPQTVDEMDQLYIARHQYPRTAFNQRLLDPWVLWSDEPFRCLEVGASRGVQLATMRRALLTAQWPAAAEWVGVDINPSVCVPVPAARGCTLLPASATDLPFPDESFDLVFTSGCLMHIPPNEIDRALREMARVSRWLVFAYEPWGETIEHVPMAHIDLPDAWLRPWPKYMQAALPEFKLFAGIRLQDVVGDYYAFSLLGRRSHPVGEWREVAEDV